MIKMDSTILMAIRFADVLDAGKIGSALDRIPKWPESFSFPEKSKCFACLTSCHGQQKLTTSCASGPCAPCSRCSSSSIEFSGS